MFILQSAHHEFNELCIICALLFLKCLNIWQKIPDLFVIYISSGCPTGWVSHGKSCYLVIDIPTLEWNAARRNCQKLGGDLAKITSATENQFVYNLLIRQTKQTAWGAWLGLHRKANTKFYWADNSPLTGYTAWSPGEPNSPSSERCGHIFGPSDRRKGKWNDIRCVLNPSAITPAPVVLCQKRSN